MLVPLGVKCLIDLIGGVRPTAASGTANQLDGGYHRQENEHENYRILNGRGALFLSKQCVDGSIDSLHRKLPMVGSVDGVVDKYRLRTRRSAFVGCGDPTTELSQRAYNRQERFKANCFWPQRRGGSVKTMKRRHSTVKNAPPSASHAVARRRAFPRSCVADAPCETGSVSLSYNDFRC